MRLRANPSTRIVVNGEATETSAATLAELVAELDFADGSVATALNGEFVPKVARSTTKLSRDDKVEIVAPRQGG